MDNEAFHVLMGETGDEDISRPAPERDPYEVGMLALSFPLWAGESQLWQMHVSWACSYLHREMAARVLWGAEDLQR